MLNNKKNLVYVILAGLFITNAVLGEIIGSKLIQIQGFTLSMGIIPWPFVFVLTDIINEYFGKDGVRRLTFISVGMIIYSYFIIFIAMNIPASNISPVDDHSFITVFSQSSLIIIGSITAFLISQLLDVTIFHFFKNFTNNRFLWLRATGSTVFSQLIDTFVVTGIAFWLPSKISFAQYLAISSNGYLFKLFIAVALTPFIYLLHFVIKKYLSSGTKEHNFELKTF